MTVVAVVTMVTMVTVMAMMFFVTMVPMMLVVAVMAMMVVAMLVVAMAGHGRAGNTERESSDRGQHESEAFHDVVPFAVICLWSLQSTGSLIMRGAVAAKLLHARQKNFANALRSAYVQ